MAASSVQAPSPANLGFTRDWNITCASRQQPTCEARKRSHLRVTATMAKGTPATVALGKAGIAFTLHEYDYDPNAERIGMQAAEALGVSPARLLKTLVAKAGGAGLCVPVPADQEGSLRKLAAAAGAKD